MDDPLTTLSQFITSHYNLEELRTLCFDLGIEYENLGGGETRDAKARELVLWAGKQSQFDRLLAALRDNRPELFEQAGLSAGAPAVEALYADLASFEDRTKPAQRKILDRLSLGQRVGFTLLAALIIAAAFALYLALSPPALGRMTGDFRAAVAGFAQAGKSGDAEIGSEIARGVFLRLQETFAELDLGFTVTIWGPDQVGAVNGQTEQARADSAAEMAEKSGADIVIYGVVDAGGVAWQVTPEFYVAEESFIGAQEITGAHDMGVPISITGQGGVASRIKVSDEFTVRAQVLSKIVVGLSFHAVGDYAQAMAILQSAAEIPGWQSDKGGRVLFLLIGNAAAKVGDLELARTYHQRALALDGEYARAHVGLAGVTYLLALQAYMRTNEPADIDLALLDQAVTTYQQAAQAAHQPRLSDISAKVHLGLGQCYLMRFYAGDEGAFSLAEVALRAVVAEYDAGDNPRIRELAAEAYGRLGLLHELHGDQDVAAEAYQQAIALLENDPQRQALLQKSLEALTRQVVHAESFALSAAQKTVPEDVLQDITFYYVQGEAPSDCKYPTRSHSEIPNYTQPEVLGSRSSRKVEVWGTKRVYTCGWGPDEVVEVTIAYPDGHTESRQVLAEPDANEPDYYQVLVHHFTPLGSPPGPYTFTFAGESGQVSHVVEFVPRTEPRLYMKDNKQLLLYNFAPNERVRLFAYRYEEQGKAALLAWNTFTVNIAGQLEVQVGGVRAAWWVALGDLSGEVTVFGADGGGKASKIRD